MPPVTGRAATAESGSMRSVVARPARRPRAEIPQGKRASFSARERGVCRHRRGTPVGTRSMTDVPLPGCDHTVAAPPIESSRPMMLDPTPSRPPLRPATSKPTPASMTMTEKLLRRGADHDLGVRRLRVPSNVRDALGDRPHEFVCGLPRQSLERVQIAREGDLELLPGLRHRPSQQFGSLGPCCAVAGRIDGEPLLADDHREVGRDRLAHLAREPSIRRRRDDRELIEHGVVQQRRRPRLEDGTHFGQLLVPRRTEERRLRGARREPLSADHGEGADDGEVDR